MKSNVISDLLKVNLSVDNYQMARGHVLSCVSDNYLDLDNLKLSDIEVYLSYMEKQRNKIFRQFPNSSPILGFYIISLNMDCFLLSKDIRLLNLSMKICQFFIDGKSKACLKYHIEVYTELLNHTYNLFENFIRIQSGLFQDKDMYISDSNCSVKDPIIEFGDAYCNVESSVVVFSPNPRSKYTLSVLESLNNKGIKVSAIVVKKLLSPSRFLKEYKRDGKRLIYKVYRKLILGDNKKVLNQGRNLQDTTSEIGVIDASVYAWGKRNKVPIIKCVDINESSVIAKLRQLNYDYGIFTGGGLLGNEILDTASKGILNCHAGILPKYRGMDVIEWPILIGAKEEIGMSVHLMVSGVDEGAVLKTYLLGIDANIKSMRYEIESYAPYMQVLALLSHIKNQEVRNQVRDQGLNFYVMHSKLFDLAYDMSRK